MASFPVPRLKSPWRRIFLPEGAAYLGHGDMELEHGKHYLEWVPNDHCYVFGRDGFCHVFGITHPLTSTEHVHEGEEQLFHAKAPADFLVTGASCCDCGNLLPPAARPGEPPEIHSPFVIELEGRYRMVYGPQSFRMAESNDLENWTPCGECFCDPAGNSRDPQILFHEDVWILAYCSGNEVRYRVSSDGLNWGAFHTLMAFPENLSPESPFLFVREGVFYLAVCTWDGVWDKREVAGAYQHRTLVFAAKSLEELPRAAKLCELPAHAPEFIHHEGNWFVSSAEYPQRGINVAELEWC